MTTKRVIATAASALLFAAMGANAGLFDKKDGEGAAQGQAGDQNAGMFTSLDANQDKQISPREAEANADVAMSFGELDKNTDGQLSAEEFSQFKSINQQQ